jgi:hypothetical protein
MAKLTRADAERWYNEAGVPEHEKRSRGGRIPDHARYGSWLRRNDAYAFDVYFNEARRSGER